MEAWLPGFLRKYNKNICENENIDRLREVYKIE